MTQSPPSPCPRQDQVELPLFQCATDDPNVLDFVQLLKRTAQWMTCIEILRALGMPETESNRRHVRSWAEAAWDEVISGQAGYRHADCATAEEVHHFCAWMDSQGDKMKLRAARTRARAHRKVG